MSANTKSTELKLHPDQLYAVLTGDVVGSTKLDARVRRNLPAALKLASAAARSVFKKAIPLNADIFRGDSWQLVVADMRLSLRVALFVRAYLLGHLPDGLGFDTRIAIGIGTITFLPKERVSQGDGSAFRKSGEVFESMPKARRMALSIEGRETPAGVGAVVTLIDALMTRWTGKQALAVIGALQGKKQGEIGASWRPPVKQQVIARHLQQANWEAIAIEGLTYVENTLEKL
jgi:hypothetical protein